MQSGATPVQAKHPCQQSCLKQKGKKEEENYRTRISTNSIMILQHIRPGSSSAQVSSAVFTAAISGGPSTVSFTLAERALADGVHCVCVCVTGVGIPNG